MAMNTDVGRIAGKTEEMKGKVEAAVQDVTGRVRAMAQTTPMRKVLGSAIGMAGAVVGTVLLAALVRRQNPLIAFSTIGERVPIIGRRRVPAYQIGSVLAGLGSVGVGSILVALARRGIGSRMGGFRHRHRENVGAESSSLGEQHDVGPGPMYSATEVGTVGGTLQHPQPIV